MRLRFRTTRLDFFWASVYGGACIGGGLFIVIVIWGMATLFTVEKVWAMDLSTLDKAIAVPFVAVAWGTVVAGLVLLACGVRTYFAKKKRVICDHTLQLGDEGIDVETDGDRSFHRYAALGGMTKYYGFWAIHDSAGIVYLFRPAQILEGDAAAFAKAFAALKKRQG